MVCKLGSCSDLELIAYGGFNISLNRLTTMSVVAIPRLIPHPIITTTFEASTNSQIIKIPLLSV